MDEIGAKFEQMGNFEEMVNKKITKIENEVFLKLSSND